MHLRSRHPLSRMPKAIGPARAWAHACRCVLAMPKLLAVKAVVVTID